jgi:hypothetical protein
MSTIVPAPSANRGEVLLQPTYFTSSIFINALRNDINNLISTYYEQYTNIRPVRPFLHFKTLWSSQGWKWMHFMVFDHRARESFLNVTLRLFLGAPLCIRVQFILSTSSTGAERMVESEAPYIRAVALFGLYTFYLTQPSGTAPALYRVAHIPIPIGAR